MSLSEEVKEMLKKCGCENPEKVAIVAFCSDGNTKTFYGDMNLKDMALAKHEIELDIIDKFISTNVDRYNVQEAKRLNKNMDAMVVEHNRLIADMKKEIHGG